MDHDLQQAWQKLFIKHAGRYIAVSGDANSVDLQVFEGSSKSDVQLHAAANGVTTPIIFYCPPLKPWLQPDIDELVQIHDRLGLLTSRVPPNKAGLWPYQYLATAMDALAELQTILKRHTRSVEQQCLLQEAQETSAK